MKRAGQSCRVEQVPLNGQVAWAGDASHVLGLNDDVPASGAIRYTCNKNFFLHGSANNYCLGGAWTSDIPKCIAKCELRKISSIAHVTQCTRNINGVTVNIPRCGSNDLVDIGTEVRIVCQNGYRQATPYAQITVCQSDGWSRPIAPCRQICGEEGAEGSPYIIGGEVTNNTKVPWHVGIYRLKRLQNDQPEFICGGTILNPKVIISAAHCFWDSLSERAHPPELFRIVAGKFYHKFNDARESNNFQVLSVAQIHLPDTYYDVEALYADDVAVVILEKYIEFKSYIAPICIDYDLFHEDRIVPSGTYGRVAGWGLEQSNGNPSDKLKTIELPVVDRIKCRKELSLSFRPFLTSDKFCVGEKHLGVGLCLGDSGGGMVFAKDPKSFKPVYYLRGIVSTGPNHRGSCDSNEYTLFTNVAYFSEFIKRFDEANRPEYVDIVPDVEEPPVQPIATKAPTKQPSQGT